MIELIDTFPDTNVAPAEYKRLLGYPPHVLLEDRAAELAQWAQSWYAQNGRPWVYARQAENLSVNNGSIDIDGEQFDSARLQSMLQQAQADGAVLVAVSAGAELEREAQRLWQEGKPDEYFFLEIFGSAVVEHLMMTTGSRLCAWADGRGLAVLPHYSPGYPEWDISQQGKLLGLMRQKNFPPALETLESGMLRPKKSLLAVFGLTRQMDRVRRLTDLVPCDNCSLENCDYRRVPYRRAIPIAPSEVSETPQKSTPSTSNYVTSIKALRRWAEERLTLQFRDDGTIDGLFRYEGTTCSNMGRALLFHYHVKLGSRDEGYPLREMLCVPAPGDEGHRFMCRYMTNAEHMMVAIEKEKPLLGQPLSDVLTWPRPVSGAGCYCEPADRKHKWGLVLETIHYALSQRDSA